MRWQRAALPWMKIICASGNLPRGQVVARGPVVTWASRSRLRQLSSLAFAGLARHALKQMKVARIAVHPGDAAVPEPLSSIEKTLEAFGRRRLAARYADLLR